jgi:hypothetical protein
MVGHPDDRFTVETGCSAIYDVRREPNDRLGVRCFALPTLKRHPQSCSRRPEAAGPSCTQAPVGGRASKGTHGQAA